MKITKLLKTLIPGNTQTRQAQALQTRQHQLQQESEHLHHTLITEIINQYRNQQGEQ